MNLRLRTLRLALLLVLIPVHSYAQTTDKGERSRTLRLCETYFGPAIDKRLNLFEANSLYVLSAIFDAKNRLEKLEVVPKYFFSESHPEWEDSDAFEHLSWTQYQNLVTRVDLIKPKGDLIAPPPAITFVTNNTAPSTSIYRHAHFTVGMLVDIEEPADAPPKVKWFRVEFGKKQKE